MRKPLNLNAITNVKLDWQNHARRLRWRLWRCGARRRNRQIRMFIRVRSAFAAPLLSQWGVPSQCDCEGE